MRSLHTHTHTQKVKLNKIPESHTEVSTDVTEAQSEEDGGRIRLGDTTGGEAVILRPIRFQCPGLWI